MLVPTDIVPGRLLSRHGRTRGASSPASDRQAVSVASRCDPARCSTCTSTASSCAVAQRRIVFVPFMAMADLYLYRTGRRLFGPADALAFRRGPDDPWVDVLDNHGDAFHLRGEIIGGQLRERGPLALRTLEAGEVLTFTPSPMRNDLPPGRQVPWRSARPPPSN
jgi:hypothetical protein